MSTTADDSIDHGPHRLKQTAHAILDDGFGNQWEKCGPTCELEIVRPGKVQCEAEHCPLRRRGGTGKP